MFQSHTVSAAPVVRHSVTFASETDVEGAASAIKSRVGQQDPGNSLDDCGSTLLANVSMFLCLVAAAGRFPALLDQWTGVAMD